MSIDFAGFCGPSYQLTNRMATIERTVNWFTVPNEMQEEKKFRMALSPCPGNYQFSQLPVPSPFNQPNRGLLELRGKAFGVNGTVVFELKQDGSMVDIGRVINDGKPVSMVANGTGQIFIASGEQGYVIPPDPTPGSLLFVPHGDFLGASYATFQDGYILVVTPNSNQFQVSGSDDFPLGDATKWSAANVSVQAGQADKLRAINSSREYVRLLGARRSQIYQDVGNSGIGGFPFQSYNETFIETGIAAAFSLADLGDSLIWIGEDARGQRACWRDHAFQPQRVSTFAVERFWQGYSRVDDAVAFPFIWLGHMLYQITFPSAVVDPVTGALHSATWVYDATASELIGRPIWTERSYQTALGYAEGRSEMFHCFCFGKHLVGSTGVDGNPGAIYQYANVGSTNANPMLLLRWSNDGGNTYGVEQNLPLGLVGEYGKRVYWNRNGYARDRVYWTRYAEEFEVGTDINGDPAAVAIVRDRIAPHLWQGNKRVIYNRIEFELTRGVGSGSPASVPIWSAGAQDWQVFAFPWLDLAGTSPFTMGIVGAELDLILCGS